MKAACNLGDPLGLIVLAACCKCRRMNMGCKVVMVTMVTMGGDLQPVCLADRLLTGLGQPQDLHKLEKKEKNV